MWLHVPSEPLVSSQASPDSTSDLPSPYRSLAAFATSRGKLTRLESWRRVCVTVPLTQLLSGLTCPPSTVDRGMEQWISSWVDFPAPTSPTPASEPASVASTPDSGRSMSGSFAMFDPDSSSWRTSQRSLFGGWTEFSETWPRSGSMRNGECFQRPRSALRTVENDSSSWPTPHGMANTDRNGKLGTGGEFAEFVTTWATPRAASDKMGRPRADARDDLQAQALMWATPSARDGRSGQASDETMERNSRPLNEQVEHWQTPSVADTLGGHLSRGGDRSNELLLRGQAKETTELTENLATKDGLWTTPCQDDTGSRTGKYAQGGTALSMQASSRPLQGTCEHGEKCRLVLNPRFVDALLGWPAGWTDLEPLAMGSWLSRQRSRLSSLVGGWGLHRER